MTYNTAEDSSLRSDSLHGSENDTFEELKDGLSSIDLKRAAFGQRNQKDISMDLNDLLQEMEEERDENPWSDSSESGKRMDWSSLNWGSFTGSFRNRGNGSSRSLLGRLGSSFKKLKADAEGSTPTTKKGRKSVRFFKFETILPSQESFRRRYSKEDRHRDAPDRSFANR